MAYLRDYEQIEALIVGGNEIDRHRIARLSTRSPFRLVWHHAADLIAARQFLNQNTISVVFVDYWLKEHGVLRFASDVEAGRFCPPTAAVLMTAEARDLLPLRARAPGFTAYLANEQLYEPTLRSVIASALQMTTSHEIQASVDKDSDDSVAKLTAITTQVRADEYYTLLARALRNAEPDAAQLALIELTAVLQEIWDDIQPEARDTDNGG